MRISPMDMRQQRFKSAMRGYDRTEVVAFLTEAADDYEHAMREIDRLRGDLMRMEALLAEHRQRENNLRDTLLTAQRLSEELKEAAQTEAKLIIREAQGRADVLLQKAQVRLDELDHDCNELKLRRRDAEGSVEATIQALYRALEFMRDQDQARSDEKILLHRPRQADQAASQNKADDPESASTSAKPRAERERLLAGLHVDVFRPRYPRDSARAPHPR